MTELNQIAGNTHSLRVNVEHGVGELSQAEEINQKLQTLKKRLSAVEGKRSDGSKNLLATMDKLKSIIEQKEIEINNLKQEIANQQQTIANQIACEWLVKIPNRKNCCSQCFNGCFFFFVTFSIGLSILLFFF